MISGTGLLLALLGFALLAVAAGIVWWINRTPSAFRRSAEGELPLFSVSLTESRYSPVKPQPTIPANRSSNGRSASQDMARKTASNPDRAEAVGRMATGSGTAGGATVASAPPRSVESTSTAPKSATQRGVEFTTAAPGSVAPRHVESNAVTPARAAPTVSTSAGASPAPLPPASSTVPLAPESQTSVSEDGVAGTQVEGHLLRFAVPQEGTLQFLPGRLEILNGLDAGREVRFVRAPGPDGLQVTFGRAEGPAYRHVQLREGTVSRSHALMAMRDGDWYLTNLSSTNPVVHNEHILKPNEERVLADGDRVEMGDVVFGFRSRYRVCA